MTDTPAPRGNAMNFEQRLERLKAIVARLEDAGLPLEEGVALYKEGLALAKACADQLQAARHEITVAGEGLVTAFDPDMTGPAATGGDDGDDH
ncbi:MAG: exodeoxyribonuclease VII small subunit [Desulfovibrionaceae bacterium]